MKGTNNFRAAAAIAAMAGAALLAGPAWAGVTNTQETITDVYADITLESDGSKLDFGAFSVGPGGTVTVDLDGNATPSVPGPILEPTLGNPPSAARFVVTGDPGLAYNITGDETVTLSGPGPDMTAILDMPATGTLSDPETGPGEDSFTVGGELTVGDALTQTLGVYIGIFSITIGYQ